MFNLRAFVKKDSASDDQTVLNLSTRLQLRMLEELKGFTTPKERLEHVIGYKTEYPKIVKTAEASVAALPANLDGDSELNSAANQAKLKAAYASAKVTSGAAALGYLEKAPKDLEIMQAW